MMSDLDDDDVRRLFDDIAVHEYGDAAPPVMCECKCTSTIAPHSDRLCHSRATTLVALHRWGWCDEVPAEVQGVHDLANLDEAGNLTSMMCDRCAEHARSVAKLQIRTMLSQPEQFGPDPHCPTCNLRTHLWTDLIATTPIREER